MWKIVKYDNTRDKPYELSFRGSFTKCHEFIKFLKETKGEGFSKRLFVELA